MPKYKVKVTRTDEYEIEIDASVWTKEAIEAWGNTFSGGNSLGHVVCALGKAWMRQDSGFHKEGFGYVRELDSNGIKQNIPFKDEVGNYGSLPDERYTKGLTIRPITEDEDYKVDAFWIRS